MSTCSFACILPRPSLRDLIENFSGSPWTTTAFYCLLWRPAARTHRERLTQLIGPMKQKNLFPSCQIAFFFSQEPQGVQDETMETHFHWWPNQSIEPVYPPMSSSHTYFSFEKAIWRAHRHFPPREEMSNWSTAGPNEAVMYVMFMD